VAYMVAQARPAHPDWFRALRDECEHLGIPFLFKQWGEWADTEDWPSEMQEHLELVGKADGNNVRVGKKRAGRLLDGVQHDGFPG
jgi:protein gp37